MFPLKADLTKIGTITTQYGTYNFDSICIIIIKGLTELIRCMIKEHTKGVCPFHSNEIKVC